ncbi:LysE family translocator [Halomonas organivorans]|uniref:Threonine/homoserine/homoserine lactone efflux protein n=1 Tax=Halomonas organivorans TaxID=257772 RepID=A0A7W5BVG8_9GAMM|nr:LysE family translocator [Halomonas organivorans]MBB3139897.1 threonine/homoserine/homoserine lactone efflux protein [Halomonas organivorans]
MDSIAQAEIIAVAIITGLAVISPGPDFAMVTRVALVRGRRAGVWCAIGIGCGVSVHLAYTLFGLGVVFASQAWILSLLRYLGAAYLIWLGLSAFWPDIRARLPGNVSERPPGGEGRPAMGRSARGSVFWMGFACNALNPKTMLFIVSLFSQVVSPRTPLDVELGYGLYVIACHMTWFAVVAAVLTLPALQARIRGITAWIERIVGLCLSGLGIKLLASG